MPSPSPLPRGPTPPFPLRHGPSSASSSLPNHDAAMATVPSSASPWRTTFGPSPHPHSTTVGRAPLGPARLQDPSPRSGGADSSPALGRKRRKVVDDT
ncbi:hypothetical protein U9M48_023402 [Paspalum notatum var. saurae]|uniref:Uncharacterized protein n=1 Tax=Paspalum notatum var. saurae TaxID=547442 RepID=A0AAQ3TNX5_PASNO